MRVYRLSSTRPTAEVLQHYCTDAASSLPAALALASPNNISLSGSTSNSDAALAWQQLSTAHGFGYNPSTFDVSDTLMPIFSQTKTRAECFADIIIPTKYTLNGSWRRGIGSGMVVTPGANQNRTATGTTTTSKKHASDPGLDLEALNAAHPWQSKLPVVYWRGSRTGGGGDLSMAPDCRFLHRHQMVAALRKLNGQPLVVSSSPTPAPAAGSSAAPPPPSPPGQGLTYQTDVCFIGGEDPQRRTPCTDSKTYGSRCQREPFESHWKYKYLVDGTRERRRLPPPHF